MLAPWADKVFRKFFSYIFVSTDDTSPYSFPLWSCSDFFRFWLDVLLIEFIGDGRIFREDFHVCDFTDEKGVGAKIYCLLDFYADISIAAFCNVGNSIDSSEPAVEAKEFVIVFSTLETESLEEGEIGLFCKGRDGKLTCPHDHVMGIVLLADGNGDLIWFSCCLNCSVDYTSIVFSVF